MNASDTHEEGAGEDDFLDPINAFGETFISIVRDGDHLDGEEAFRCEDFVALREEGFVKFITNRFDHFDGDNLVELTFDVAIVLDEYLKFIFKSGIFDTLTSILCLLFRDGDACNFTSIFGGSVAAKASPAAANF